MFRSRINYRAIAHKSGQVNVTRKSTCSLTRIARQLNNIATCATLGRMRERVYHESGRAFKPARRDIRVIDFIHTCKSTPREFDICDTLI